MNNKGFTLIELIVSIIILALILSIGAYSIISIVKESKEKNYQTLLKSIKSGTESYVIECKYGDISDGSITCSNQITLGDLVKYGYLSGNAKVDNKKDEKYTIVNPKDNNSISNCVINITKNANGTITITPNNPTGSCPTAY